MFRRVGQVIALVVASLAFAAAATAQVPSGNVFFGYSYYNTPNISSGTRSNLNGWEGSVEGKVLRWVGIVGDFSGYYGNGTAPEGSCPPGTGCVASNVSLHEYNALFGPRVGVSMGRVRPFAEALFGFGRLGSNGYGAETDFATALGGGFDYKIIRPIAWRFQGDYVQTRFFGATQNNVRQSTGLVLRF
jgi:hypothetical protein